MEFFPNEKFLITSDDMEFCKTFFKGEQFEFSELKEEEAFRELASCKGHIIANSSFGWWAAFLSPNKGKVIFPKDWYSDKIKRTECPIEWLAL